MTKALLLLVAVVSAVVRGGVGHHHRKPHHSAERDLHDVLMRHYDPESRPVMNANHSVQVNLSLALSHIIDLVEKNQTLITQMTLTLEWYDEMLVWKPHQYDGMTQIILPSEQIWLPDLYIFNNAERGFEGFITGNSSRTRVDNTGHVLWSLFLIVKSSCAVEMSYFPFDNQKCQIRIGSWLYDGSQINLVLARDGFDMSNYINNSEFHLLDIHFTREALSSENFSAAYFNVAPMFSPSPDATYPQAVLSLHIRRKPVYYLYTIVAPTLILCIMMLFSFQLPCESGDKVGIGLTVFLSLYVLQLAIAENIPESNSLPLISLFLLLVMTLNSLSLMFATLVINIKKKGDRKPCQAVPDWLLIFCQKVLAKITFTRKLEFRDFYTTCMEEEKLLKKVQLRNPSEDLTALLRVRRGAGIIKSVLEEEGEQSPEVLRRRTGKNSVSTPAAEAAGNNNNHSTDGTTYNNLLASPSISRRSSRCESSTSSKLIMAHKNRKLAWYFVAEVMDKILFMLFLLALVVVVMTTLWIIPEIHKWD